MEEETILADAITQAYESSIAIVYKLLDEVAFLKSFVLVWVVCDAVTPCVLFADLSCIFWGLRNYYPA